jgi:hypothetical protein
MMQRGGDLRKRREIHIDGERVDDGERAQYDNDQIAVFGLGHKFYSDNHKIFYTTSLHDAKNQRR